MYPPPLLRRLSAVLIHPRVQGFPVKRRRSTGIDRRFTARPPPVDRSRAPLRPEALLHETQSKNGLFSPDLTVAPAMLFCSSCVNLFAWKLMNAPWGRSLTPRSAVSSAERLDFTNTSEGVMAIRELPARSRIVSTLDLGLRKEVGTDKGT